MTAPFTRLIRAVALAPLTAPVVLLLYVVVYSVAKSRYDSMVEDWLEISFYAFLIAFMATLVIGLPTHLILRRLGLAKPSNYVIVGIVVALLPFLAILLVDGGFSINDLTGYPTMAVGCAGVVSWAFAKIALKSHDMRGAEEHDLGD